MNRGFASCTFFVLLVLLLLHTFYIKPAVCQDIEYKVINVTNVVRLDDKKEVEYRDLYINYGSLDGASIGDFLTVHREVKKSSFASGAGDKTVDVPIGTLKIILVQPDSCSARLIKLAARADNPLVEYDTVMIGDIVTLAAKGVEIEEPVTMIIPDNVLFDFDKYDIRDDAKSVLKDIAGVISKKGYKKVIIDGHTDSIGTEL